MSVIDEYIEAQNEEYQPYLKGVCEELRRALPNCTEKISWQMPTFYCEHNVIHFACMKKHIGIYPGAECIEHFKEEFAERGLKFSKGALQIPYTDNLPLDLIQRMAKYCIEQNVHP